MSMSPRPFTFAATLVACSLAAPGARADVDNPHEQLHQPATISPYHWGAVAQGELDVRGMRAVELQADQTAATTSLSPGNMFRPVPRLMQSGRASQRSNLLGRVGPTGNRTTQRGVGMVRRFVSTTKGSLRDRLINGSSSSASEPGPTE
jgi:hypothetical protein